MVLVKCKVQNNIALTINSPSLLTKRLVDGQIRLDDKHGCTSHLHLLKDVTSPSVEHTVDASNGHLGTLDLTQVDGLHQSGCCRQYASVQTTPGGGDDLTTSSVDGVSVKCHIVDVEPHSSHVLF